jgi:hypothetical protein
MPPGPPPGPPGRARFPVAGGNGAVGRGGTTLSDGRSLDAAGRVGIAGTAEVPGAFGSSILSLMLGGTMRPGTCAGFGGGAGVAVGAGRAAGGRATTGGSTTGGAGGGSSTTGTGSGTSATGAGDSSGSSTSTGGGSSRAGSSTATDGAAGFAVLTSRGGASVGAAGFAGSGFLALAAGFLAPGFAAGPSANMSPPGSVMLRSRARRSTNCRATTSSIVLDALFSSMPCARLSNASTSWLLVLRSSATL